MRRPGRAVDLQPLLRMVFGLAGLALTSGAADPARTDATARPVAAAFRGDGSATYAASRPPTRWSLAPRRNIAWSAGLPCGGNASPVVVSDLVVTTCEPNVVAAVSLRDGSPVWERRVSVLDAMTPTERAPAAARLAESEDAARKLEVLQPRLAALKRDARRSRSATAGELRVVLGEASALQGLVERDRDLLTMPTGDMIGYASATPVTDGSAVYATFANGLVAAFGLDGKPLWTRRVDRATKPMNGYSSGHSASSLLVDGTLVVPLGRLRGLDTATGATRWEADDFLDFGTPTLVRTGGRVLVATASGSLVDAKTGTFVTQVPASIFYVGPVAVGDTVFFAGALPENAMSQLGGAPAAAFKIVPAGGSVSSEKAWSVLLPAVRTYATPVVSGGLLYTVDVEGALRTIDAKSGKTLSTVALPRTEAKPFASPVVAGDRLYVSFDDGTTHVFQPGPTPKQLGTSTLEPGRATPVFGDDWMLVRTDRRVHLVRE